MTQAFFNNCYRRLAKAIVSQAFRDALAGHQDARRWLSSDDCADLARWCDFDYGLIERWARAGFPRLTPKRIVNRREPDLSRAR